MKDNSSILSLGNANITKLLIKYSLPAITAMTAMSLYNITDSIFIGRGVGAMALSGLSISFPLINLQTALGTLIGVGASAISSIRLGQKDYTAANHILCNVVIINILISIFVTVGLMFFLKPIIIFFGASSQSLPYAYEFIRVILIGTIVTNTYMGLNGLLRTIGHPRKVMYSTIATIFINLVLNYVFIFQFKWGIQGSAWATVIAQLIVLIWQILFFSTKTTFIHFQKQFFVLKKEIVKDIFSIGLSPFSLHCSTCLIVIIINKSLSFYGGDLEVGAYGIVTRIVVLFMMIIFGINQGMQPIAGYNYGAGLYSRVNEVFEKASIFAVLVMLFGAVIMELFPHFVSSFFSDEINLVNTAARGLRYVFICAPLAGFQVVAISFFQSIGKAYRAIILSVLRQVIILIPLLIILPKFMGPTGIWVSYPIGDLISSVLAIYMILAQYKQFKESV
ncbi:MAG: MATE family efflux transporter [Endomicrobium sp.]|jgi:putative MATE family efflux protein|nr:MATE family efflux transporter [Endomicrobium sp.]